MSIESVTLQAPSGYRSYRWSTGQSSQSIVVNASGDYSVSVIDNGNCNATSLAVNVVAMTTTTSVFVSSSSTSTTASPPVTCRECHDTLDFHDRRHPTRNFWKQFTHFHHHRSNIRSVTHPRHSNHRTDYCRDTNS